MNRIIPTFSRNYRRNISKRKQISEANHTAKKRESQILESDTKLREITGNVVRITIDDQQATVLFIKSRKQMPSENKVVCHSE